jgi:hypothetical protein
VSIGLELDSPVLLILGLEASCAVGVADGRYEDAARCFALAESLRGSQGYGYDKLGDVLPVEGMLRDKLGDNFERVIADARSTGVAAVARELSSRTT